MGLNGISRLESQLRAADAAAKRKEARRDWWTMLAARLGASLAFTALLAAMVKVVAAWCRMR